MTTNNCEALKAERITIQCRKHIARVYEEDKANSLLTNEKDGNNSGYMGELYAAICVIDRPMVKNI